MGLGGCCVTLLCYVPRTSRPHWPSDLLQQQTQGTSQVSDSECFNSLLLLMVLKTAVVNALLENCVMADAGLSPGFGGTSRFKRLVHEPNA